MMKGLNPNNLFIPSPAPGVARKQIMELYNSNFYKILIRLTESPHPKVQYNCAGVIGHLAINGKQLHTLLHCHGNCYSVLSALIYVKPTLSVFNGIIILSNLYVWKWESFQLLCKLAQISLDTVEFLCKLTQTTCELASVCIHASSESGKRGWLGV